MLSEWTRQVSVLVRYIPLHRPPFGARMRIVGWKTGCGQWVAVRFLFVVALQERKGCQVVERLVGTNRVVHKLLPAQHAAQFSNGIRPVDDVVELLSVRALRPLDATVELWGTW